MSTAPQLIVKTPTLRVILNDEIGLGSVYIKKEGSQLPDTCDEQVFPTKPFASPPEFTLQSIRRNSAFSFSELPISDYTYVVLTPDNQRLPPCYVEINAAPLTLNQRRQIDNISLAVLGNVNQRSVLGSHRLQENELGAIQIILTVNFNDSSPHKSTQFYDNKFYMRTIKKECKQPPKKFYDQKQSQQKAGLVVRAALESLQTTQEENAGSVQQPFTSPSIRSGRVFKCLCT